ncbi:MULTISPECIES: flagellar hook-associated protein FlgK [Campylobacter]|uniref:Flagellar hook-associated protein FlgK n=1 Tax=Campylobacter molothri TaxID=1032242 RepID=A0ACC5W0C5_9BACT|nr:flagellar hook-associated protein FlgK [Campylobacter sp. RM10537]MBZ7928619.1 flagellar hook-associated protein FlgK [Campylobacter sp. RM10542]MBZ7941295.1 flagellar hook-associated protein FlgK [Campylobacter sp. W0047]MBZ7948714.1 flagellar hook-associated protein FlgK [Campylobacter sp. RM9929]MBZ7948823.1 flagellar hook-associated protein FlgK [Campylobacter sp. RM10534]MBZ7957851.1 flagellar hook-associated protein FlgK [Campylobacter sp. RM9760]MBZ7973720.1 flagellar hook-associate
MGIFGTLYTGVTGLKASEVQIATTSNNISNANATFYTRQRVVQTTNGYVSSNGVQVGTGTAIESIVRLHDEYSYFKLKGASTQLEYTKYMASTLQEISERFPDLQNTGILQDLENYNKAWNDFASNPNENATKIALVKASQTLTESINNTFSTLDKIQKKINNDIKSTVEEINRIGEEIATINKQIYGQEALPTEHANELRDRRDELELTLSKLVSAVASKNEINQDNRLDTTITDPGHQYNLSIEGFSIVDGINFHPLKLDYDDKNKSYSIYYETADEKVRDLTGKISGGQLGAQLDLRGRNYDKSKGKYSDGIIQGYMDSLDTFSKTMINETNNLYASSAKSPVTSDYLPGLQGNIPLMNYDRTIQPGSFDIVLYDEKGDKKVTKTINIDVNTTMDDIVRQIKANTDDNNNKDPNDDVDDLINVSFSYDPTSNDGLFQLTAKSGYKIAIEDKGTNFAGAFSIGGFFSGNSASDIKVKDSILSDPSTVRASLNGVDSGNDMANKIIQLQYDKVNFYNEDGTIDHLTMEEYYRKFTGKIGSDGENNNVVNASNQTFYNSVYSEYQSKSGVNTNEELAALIQWQSSYGASAKIVTTIDQMLDTLLGIKS